MPIPSDEALDTRLDGIGRSSFRAKFHLREAEIRYARSRGRATIADHAHEFVATRLAPAHPHKDGQQTPMGGHPVFRGQHATATCCRGCLAKHHGYPKGRELTAEEQADVVAVLMRWIEQELRTAPAHPASRASARHPTRKTTLTGEDPMPEPSTIPLF